MDNTLEKGKEIKIPGIITSRSLRLRASACNGRWQDRRPIGTSYAAGGEGIFARLLFATPRCGHDVAGWIRIPPIARTRETARFYSIPVGGPKSENAVWTYESRTRQWPT
jgi:hypothetical protein